MHTSLRVPSTLIRPSVWLSPMTSRHSAQVQIRYCLQKHSELPLPTIQIEFRLCAQKLLLRVQGVSLLVQQARKGGPRTARASPLALQARIRWPSIILVEQDKVLRDNVLRDNVLLPQDIVTLDQFSIFNSSCPIMYPSTEWAFDRLVKYIYSGLQLKYRV